MNTVELNQLLAKRHILLGFKLLLPLEFPYCITGHHCRPNVIILGRDGNASRTGHRTEGAER